MRKIRVKTTGNGGKCVAKGCVEQRGIKAGFIEVDIPMLVSRVLALIES